MSLYMYEFGVIVEAETEEDAWELVRQASQALDKIDFEGESSVDGPTLCDKRGFPGLKSSIITITKTEEWNAEP